MNDRAEYIAGLRALASLLEQHDDLPLPYYGTDFTPMPVFCRSREQLATWARVLPGRWDKNVDEQQNNYGFSLNGALAGFHLDLRAHRDEICQRVVIGVEEVTEQVPDPSVQVPLVEVTREVETVQWRCMPLLVGSTTDGAP